MSGQAYLLCDTLIVRLLLKAAETPHEQDAFASGTYKRLITRMFIVEVSPVKIDWFLSHQCQIKCYRDLVT